MKQILTITVVLAILAIAIVGCLFIFEVMSFDDASSTLLKVVGGILLLGACSAAITALMGATKNSRSSE